jgi:uridylate kinase
MDLTAITLCADNNLPMFVFDITDPRNLIAAVAGEQRGTWITKESES